MNYVYLKIPRFDGRKTIAFNGAVFIAASGWLTAAYSGLTGFGPIGETGLYALAAVALVNGVLRVLTSRPVWWRDRIWIGVDLAGEGCDRTVYHKAAEFVNQSDSTDWNDREQSQDRLQREYTPPRIVPYADFQRDLDQQLCDAREEFIGSFCDPGDRPELPLDAEETRN